MSGRDEQASVVLHDMIWPRTGLETAVHAPARPKDQLGEDDLIELQIDFVTLALSPTELIQLASALRMSVDALLDHHPALQRTVIEAFDIRP